MKYPQVPCSFNRDTARQLISKAQADMRERAGQSYSGHGIVPPTAADYTLPAALRQDDTPLLRCLTAYPFGYAETWQFTYLQEQLERLGVPLRLATEIAAAVHSECWVQAKSASIAAAGLDTSA